MTDAQQAKSKIQVLTPEDLENAVLMLAEEERVARPKSTGTIANLFWTFFQGLLSSCWYFALSSGFIVVWFRPRQGLILLGLGAVTFIVIAITAFFHDATKGTLLLQGQASALGQIALKAWDKKFPTEGLVIISGCLIWLTGLVWMFVGLITHRDVFPRLLILVAFGNLIWCTAQAVNFHRRFRYFSRVGRLKERLELLSEAAPGGEPAVVSVSEKDRALLSQVEIRQVNRTAVRNLEEVRKQTQIYSVAIAPTLLDYLGQLDNLSRHEVRVLLDELQNNPRPEGSRPLEGGADAQIMNLETENYLITYAVNEPRQRIDVQEISPLREGVTHAS